MGSDLEASHDSIFERLKMSLSLGIFVGMVGSVLFLIGLIAGLSVGYKIGKDQPK
jgi:hypothetical protein